MSVEAQTVEYAYTGDSVSTAFPFPSRFLSNSDILVGINGVLQTGGYTVAGAGVDAGGSVTFSTAPTTGARVLLLRKPPVSQLLDFVNGQTVLENTLDTGLDKLTMIAQFLSRRSAKSLRLGDFDPDTLDPLPSRAQRALKFVAFGVDGQPIAASPPVSVSRTDLDFGTVLSAVGAALPPAQQYFTTAGYYEPGDGGGALYKVVNAEPVHAGKIPLAGGKWGEIAEPQPSVRMFGAIGDGASGAVDTPAIEAAFDWARRTLKESPNRQMGWAYKQAGVRFPPGHYIYSGTGIAQDFGSVIMHAEPRTVTLELTNNVYLLTVSGLLLNTYVKGIHFIGGKGVLRYTNAAANVLGTHVVEDNYFDNYTECAFSNEADDHPYWKIQRNMFLGAAAGETIGFAIGGYIDGTEIRGNAFLRNKYHMKLGPRISGNIYVENNDFISWNLGIRAADIWIVPNTTDPFAINSGIGTIFAKNKFGNENLETDKPRVLFALEGAGATRASRHHATTWVPSSGSAYVSGLDFVDNAIHTSAGTTSPFIKSYIAAVAGLEWRGNMMSGAQHTYLCEFMGTDDDTFENYAQRNWFVELTQNTVVAPFLYGVTNRGMGLSIDQFCTLPDSTETILAHSSIGDDAGYTDFFTGIVPAQISVGGGASKANVADVYGQARASEITVAAAGIGSHAFGNLYNVGAGMAWLELDIGRAAARSVSVVTLVVRNYTTNSVAFQRPFVIRSPGWKTIRVPFIIPPSTSPGSWQWLAFSSEFEAGVLDRFKIGRVHVYSGKQPANIGHLRTADNGEWDGAHIVLGGYHIWVDSAGKLRIKYGAPTSALDGAPVV